MEELLGGPWVCLGGSYSGSAVVTKVATCFLFAVRLQGSSGKLGGQREYLCFDMHFLVAPWAGQPRATRDAIGEDPFFFDLSVSVTLFATMPLLITLRLAVRSIGITYVTYMYMYVCSLAEAAATVKGAAISKRCSLRLGVRAMNVTKA